MPLWGEILNNRMLSSLNQRTEDRESSYTMRQETVWTHPMSVPGHLHANSHTTTRWKKLNQRRSAMTFTSSGTVRGALRVQESMARPSQVKRSPFTDTELEQAPALMGSHVESSIAILAITARLDVVAAKALLVIFPKPFTETSISEK